MLERLIDAKPLNSGTASTSFVGVFAGSIGAFVGVVVYSREPEDVGGPMLTGGEETRLALVVARDNGRLGVVECVGLVGEMDRARSKQIAVSLPALAQCFGEACRGFV